MMRPDMTARGEPLPVFQFVDAPDDLVSNRFFCQRR